MKRNKHILVNLTEEQYNALKYLSNKINRKNSDTAYLLLIDALNNEIVKYVNVSNDVKPLKYNNDD